MNKKKHSRTQLHIDLHSHTALLNGKKVSLRPLESRLMVHLLSNSNRVITKSELIEKIWDGLMTKNTANKINVHLSRLRRKINHGFHDKIIITLPKTGYIIKKCTHLTNPCPGGG